MEEDLEEQQEDIWSARNIFKIQDNESMISFIEYMPAGKALLDYANLFSPNDYKKKSNIMYRYFKGKYGRISKSWV